jgi:GH15 family glucan-1,4-alpha-glucosidase
MHARCFLAATFAALVVLPAHATNLVTGNGFGFAVVNPETATITKFYAHPYSFTSLDPKNPLGEGIETTNFLKSLSFGDASAKNASAEYEDDSHIIHLRNSYGEGFAFMPFGFARPALVVTCNPTRSSPGASSWKIDWRQRPEFQEVSHQPRYALARLAKFEATRERLLVIFLHAPIPVESSAIVLVSIEDESDVPQAIRDFDAWRANRSPTLLVQRELSDLEHWRVKPTIHFASEAERHLYRQSEVMLRIAQSREPNTATRHGNGLIVASLPDGVWFTPWVRDMAWATVALARMGHKAEARAAVLAYFNAQPTGKMRAQVNNADYQISVVRYWGDGAEEPFFTMEGAANIEYDDWGEILWVLGEYLRKYDDPALLRAPTFRGPLYDSARDFIVKPLLANLEPFSGGEIVTADTSIWEEHQKDKKHFAFSTAMAIVGLREFADVARRAGDAAARVSALHHAGLLEKGFNAAFIRNGHFHGTLEDFEKNDIDGALLAIIHFGLITDPALIRDTVDRMELLRVSSGGYRRVRSNYTDPAIFEYWYERQEFVFVDFALAEVLRATGRAAAAAAIEQRIVTKAAADHNIIPEMYVSLPCQLFPGAIGDPTGAKPMAGYGAGAFILDLLDRESGQLREASIQPLP